MIKHIYTGTATKLCESQADYADGKYLRNLAGFMHVPDINCEPCLERAITMHSNRLYELRLQLIAVSVPGIVAEQEAKDREKGRVS